MAQKESRKDLFRKDLLKMYLKERRNKKIETANDASNTAETHAESNNDDNTTTCAFIDKKIPSMVTNGIQIVSDIHLEFVNVIEKMPKIEVRAPILALLGDIGYPKSAEYQQFIKDCSARFKHVILIAGNHEYYTACIEGTHTQMQHIADQYKNVHFLQCKTLEIPDILPQTVIIGCTLWVEFESEHAEKASQQVNDYVYISTDSNMQNALTVQDTNAMYQRHLQFIRDACDTAQSQKKRVIVLTHHSPTDYQCIDPNYFNEISYRMNFTNLEHLFQPPIVAWCFGHTHYNVDIMVRCNLAQMQCTEDQQNINSTDDVDKQTIEEKNDESNSETESWYVRVASNQQGYLHRGICDGYMLDKVIAITTHGDLPKSIEMIDYGRLVTLPYLNRLNKLSSNTLAL